jgi:hypothetical protein
MFGNRDGLSMVIDECVYGSSLMNFASHSVLALQQMFAVTD